MSAMQLPPWLSKIEQPTKRINPSGKTVWRARATNPQGKRVALGTRKLRSEAQQLILDAYERWQIAPTNSVGAYAAREDKDTSPLWFRRHPRSERTNVTNESRLRKTLDIEVDGVKLRDWPLRELRRKHFLDVADYLLRVDGRAVGGAQDILGMFSAMFEDAITDELADVNPVRGVRVKSNDPRIRKATRELRVWTFDQMHAFAHAARTAAWGSGHPEQADQVEAMIRSLSDGAFRLGEMLGLHRQDFDGQLFRLRGTAHNGRLLEGNTETKKHVREVPCPPGLATVILAMPTRIDTQVLFPTLSGRLWWARNFYRDVWAPTVKATGMVCVPHEFRHSYLTHLRAMGVHDADLAEVAGHGLDTLIGRYSHPVRRSFGQIREMIG